MTISRKLHEKLDLTGKRRVFAVGDVHGEFDKLERRLQVLGFDESQDFLISVGDLVDRGPQSTLAIKWIKKPWFKHIIGNHEEFCLDSLNGNGFWHYQNGGEWFHALSYEQQKEHTEALLNAPYLLEVLTPGKQKIGFVHADLNHDDWNQAIEFPHFETFAWSRSRIKHAAEWPESKYWIDGVDWLIMGHTVVTIPIKRGNCVWIDTGACFKNELTVIDVDNDLDKINTLL